MKTYSETRADLLEKNYLKNTIFKDWDDLNKEEKEKIFIWIYSNCFECFFIEQTLLEFIYDLKLRESVDIFENKYKTHLIQGSYRKEYVNKYDLENFFIIENSFFIYEFLSIYGYELSRRNYEIYQKFINNLNDIFFQFGINIEILKINNDYVFAPKQPKEIIKNIYEPTLELISKLDKTIYLKVHETLSKSFDELKAKNYFSAIGKMYDSIHFYLKIYVEEDIDSKKDLWQLFDKLKNKYEKLNIYSNFYETFFGVYKSFLSRVRIEKSDKKANSNLELTYSETLNIFNLGLVIFNHIIGLKFEQKSF